MGRSNSYGGNIINFMFYYKINCTGDDFKFGEKDSKNDYQAHVSNKLRKK